MVYRDAQSETAARAESLLEILREHSRTDAAAYAAFPLIVLKP